MHAQCLIAGLETIECGASQILSSEERRAEALTYATSFVQFDEPDDPARFARIGRRVVDFLAEFASCADEKSGSDDFAQYVQMKNGVAGILREELGLPEVCYYE